MIRSPVNADTIAPYALRWGLCAIATRFVGDHVEGGMYRNSILCRFALFASLAAISTFPGFGQAFYGSVVGTVTDPSGGALTGAAVTLTNVGTGERRQALSGSGGDYQFLNLVPGAYRVQV